MLDIMNSSVLLINLPAILIANGLGVWLMVTILFSRRKRLKRLPLDGRIFYWMCRICLILCLLETLGFALDGKDFVGARPILLGINTLLISLDCLLVYLWVCYVDFKLFASKQRMKKIYSLIAIPAGILCLLSVMNLFVDIFFSFGPDNNYQRQPLLLLVYVVTYGYMTYGAVLAYYYRKRMDQYLFMPVIALLIPIYLGSVIQLCVYGISLIWPSTALGLTLLYLNLQHEESFLDPLTGLYNRNYLLHCMDHMTKQSQKGKQITGIMLDINYFKRINDTYGHLKGDRILREVGRILIRAADRDAVVARYGGDEFIIILEEAKRERVGRIRESIRRQLEEYHASSEEVIPISLSVGIAELEKLDVYKFFQEMDRSMYDEKRSYYLSQESQRQ